jgi:hypothetical protein
LFEKLDFEARLAFAQAGYDARASGATELSLPVLTAAIVSSPSVATAVLDHDALLDDLGARRGPPIDFGTMPGGAFLAPLDQRAKRAFAALEQDTALAAPESIGPARVLLAFAAADAELRAILDRNDLTEEVLRKM